MSTYCFIHSSACSLQIGRPHVLNGGLHPDFIGCCSGLSNFARHKNRQKNNPRLNVCALLADNCSQSINYTFDPCRIPKRRGFPLYMEAFSTRGQHKKCRNRKECKPHGILRIAENLVPVLHMLAEKPWIGLHAACF